ncbi:MAG: fructuronate reductase, partial [Loktanella sp.]|nr:fructuronate reductase [Loktanella sp.]
PPVPGIDLTAYSAQLLARFANPRLQHQTAQIASDTSKKLPQRILTPLRWHLDQSGTVPPLMALVLASWLVWLLGQGDTGDALPFNDPAADDLRRDLRHATNPVATLLSFRPVFPQDLADDPRVSDAIGKAFAELRQNGARSALSAFI